MNKFLVLATLLFAVGKAEAHSHPSVDSLTHSLEHLTMGYPAWVPYLAWLGLMVGMALLMIWRGRRLQ